MKFPNKFTKQFRQYGFSLIELLITTVLSLLVLSTLITNYLSIKKSYEFHESLQQIKESGIIATQLISRDIQHAGLASCINNINEKINGTVIQLGVSQSIPPEISSRIKPQTEVLTITKAMTQAFIIVKQQNQLILPAHYPIKIGDYVLLSDCHQSQIIVITKIISQQMYQVIIADRKLLSFNYPLELMPLEKIAYFIGKSTEKNQQGEPIYSLHRKDLLNSAQAPDALLEGVENLQFTIKENNKNPTTEKNQWQHVRGVEINLVLQSKNSYYLEPHHYVFLNQTISPTTRQLHRSWSFYAAIR